MYRYLSSRLVLVPLLSFLFVGSIYAQSFITTWQTDNPGSSGTNEITIPTTGIGYNYNVDWGDTNSDLGVTGNITHTYSIPGTYTVTITGTFPRIFFNNTGDRQKILTVEQWGTQVWTSMASAFRGCVNLSVPASDAPDLSGATDMTYMFRGATSFNDNISSWNVSSIINMTGLFRNADTYNQPLNTWDVTNVTNMSEMFEFALDFDQDIRFVALGANTGGDAWNTTNVMDMSAMFGGAFAFNQPIGNWNVNNVTKMNIMFSVATVFDQDIGNWNVSNVTNFIGMFNGASAFNQDISTKIGLGNYGGDAWNVSNIMDMSSLLQGTIAFNQDISNWDVSSVTDMGSLFSGATAFNQDISTWIVTNVNDMPSMFADASAFNQDISGWNVSMVNDMNGMFDGAISFNQDIGRIGGWDVSGVSDMRQMFFGATTFDQDLGGWDVTNLSLAFNMFNNSGLSVANYDKLLQGWEAQTLKLNVNFGASTIFYCAGETARSNIISTFNWTITDAGSKCISLFDGPDTTAPEITNAQPQAIDFGSTSTTKSRTFTLLNNQAIPITNVQITNPASGFPASVVFVSIAAGATQTFTIDLTGTVGTYTETVTITSDDFGGSFQFDVTGEVTATPEPEIKVFEGSATSGTEILNGISTYFIGSVLRGNDIFSEVTITNLGVVDLNISNISFSGTVFSVISATALTIPPDGTEIVQIQLSGIQGGDFVETLTIESDDSDEAVFDFIVNGDIIGPDLLVVDGLDIFSDPEILNMQGIPVDFGSAPSGTDIVRQLTITNENPVNLSISNISISGTAFSFTPAAPINVVGQVDGIYDEHLFEITLSGATAGTFNETVTITSDDDVDPVFQFPLTGTIIATGCVAPPTADAGLDQSICGAIAVSLSGSITNASSPSWATSGDGMFDNNLILAPTYTPGANDLANGTAMLTLSTEDPDGAGPCIAASSQITLTINSLPTANAGSNVAICQGNTLNLSGSIGGAAITSAWSTSGDGSFNDVTLLNAVYTPGSNDTSNGSVDLTLTTDDPDGAGPCVAALSALTLTIDQAATVNVGGDILVCPSDMVNLSATIAGSANNPMWATSGSGTFDDNTSLIAIYTPNAADISAGTVDLTLTVNATGTCPQVMDQLTVTIAQPITAGSSSIQSNVGVAANVDVIAASTINTGDVIVVTILTNPAKGTAAILGNNTIDYTASTGTVGADSFDYQICNQCNLCSTGTVTIDILNAPPVITPPSSPITSVAGQSVIIPFLTFISDINDNIDVNSIKIIAGPTSNATASFDASFNLTIDYSNTPFAGTDQLTIEVCDLLGACAQITLSIEVDGEITPFNGISPNGDGLNDYFLIQNIQFLEPENKVSIFNRWGDKVFNVENYHNDIPERRFNGLSNSDKELSSGVYFYKIEFSSGREGLNGYVTLKR